MTLGRRIAVLTLALATLLGSGCALLERKPTIVSDSQLNWLAVKYRPLDPARPPCRIEIVGAGYLDFMIGASPLVADSFATDTENINWDKMNHEKLGMQPGEARRLMQFFVDGGLLQSAKKRGRRQLDDPDVPGIALFRWRINGDAGGSLTSDPELLAIVEDIINHLSRE